MSQIWLRTKTFNWIKYLRSLQYQGLEENATLMPVPWQSSIINVSPLLPSFYLSSLWFIECQTLLQSITCWRSYRPFLQLLALTVINSCESGVVMESRKHSRTAEVMPSFTWGLIYRAICCQDQATLMTFTIANWVQSHVRSARCTARNREPSSEVDGLDTSTRNSQRTHENGLIIIIIIMQDEFDRKILTLRSLSCLHHRLLSGRSSLLREFRLGLCLIMPRLAEREETKAMHSGDTSCSLNS